jgi:dipeptidyl aminopeptidase/acylaminoacyl peptidase
MTAHYGRRVSAQGHAYQVAQIPGREMVQLVPQPDNQLWTTEKGFTIVLARDEATKREGFWAIDLGSRDTRKLLEEERCFTCAQQERLVTVVGKGTRQRLAYFSESASNDSDVWWGDAEFQDVRRLTHLNPGFDSYQLGHATVIKWLSDDGEPLRGALLLPAGYQAGKQYPLVVWVYAGRSLSDRLTHFGSAGFGPFNMQLLATRGYAVLLPDSPQHVSTSMLNLAKTVLPGINKVIEMGIADPHRLALMRHSNGGYGVLSLIVQTQRFRAAVEMDGTSDLVGLFGLYGEMDRTGAAFGISILEHGQDAMGGSLWQFKDRYIENSPVYYFDRITTPLLIVHGAQDDAVAAFLGDQAFVTLRRLGKKVVYARYEGEDHSPLYWRYDHQLDLCKRILRWLDEDAGGSQQSGL